MTWLSKFIVALYSITDYLYLSADLPVLAQNAGMVLHIDKQVIENNSIGWDF